MKATATRRPAAQPAGGSLIAMGLVALHILIIPALLVFGPLSGLNGAAIAWAFWSAFVAIVSYIFAWQTRHPAAWVFALAADVVMVLSLGIGFALVSF